MARRGRGSSFLGILFNAASLLIVLLILLVIAGVVAVAAAPDLVAPLAESLGLDLAQDEPETQAVPTSTTVAMALVPTATETQVSQSLRPTWTPALGVGGGGEPTATNTRRATLEPSITPTFPPATNTPTPTGTPTPTETPGPPPTATNTRSPFPFTKSDTSPMYLQNFANNAGCNWLGIAGEVLDLNRNPVASGQYRVHVWGSGIDERVPVGGAPAYGPSGYEQFVFNAPVIRDYNIQLETTNGSAVSQVYAVQTRASCNQNLLQFNFVQNHE